MSKKITVREFRTYDQIRIVVVDGKDEIWDGSSLVTKLDSSPIRIENWYRNWLIGKTDFSTHHPNPNRSFMFVRQIGNISLSGRRNTWKKRFSVLTDKELLLYKKEQTFQKNKKKGSRRIQITDIIRASLTGKKSKRKKENCFEIQTNKKTLVFSCQDRETSCNWVGAIQSVKRLSTQINQYQSVAKALSEGKLPKIINNLEMPINKLSNLQDNEGFGPFLSSIKNEQFTTSLSLCKSNYNLSLSKELERCDLNLMNNQLSKISDLVLIQYLLKHLKESEKEIQKRVTNCWISRAINEQNLEMIKILSMNNIKCFNDNELTKNIFKFIRELIDKENYAHTSNVLGIVDLNLMGIENDENNLLFHCINNNNLSGVNVLIERGCDPNLRTQEEFDTALHLCSKKIKIDNFHLLLPICEYLLSHGANGTLINKKCNTALFEAIQNFHTNVIPEALSKKRPEILDFINKYIAILTPPTQILSFDQKLIEQLQNFSIDNFYFKNKGNNDNKELLGNNIFNYKWILNNLKYASLFNSFKNKIDNRGEEGIKIVLQLISESRHSIRNSNDQLKSQLIGRLNSLVHYHPGIKKLMNGILSYRNNKSWLMPLIPSLSCGSSFLQNNYIRLKQICFQHLLPINGVSSNLNGNVVISGDEDGKLIFWDIAKGATKKIIDAHSKEIRSVSISEKAEIVVTAGNDLTIKIWNSGNYELFTTLSGHKSFINCIDISHTGQYIVSCSDDQTVKIWSTFRKQIDKTLYAHNCAVNSVRINFNQVITSADENGCVHFWDIENGMLKTKINAHNSPINTIDVFGNSPETLMVVTGSDDHTCKIYNLSNSKLVNTFYSHESRINSLKVNSTGEVVISSSIDGTIWLWNPLNTRKKYQIIDPERKINCMTFSQFDNNIIFGLQNGSIRIYQLNQSILKKNQNNKINSLIADSQNKNSNILITKNKVDHDDDNNNKNKNNNKKKKKKKKNIQTNLNISDHNDDKFFKIMFLKLFKQIKFVKRGHNKEITSICSSPDNKLIATGSKDCKIKIWDTSNLRVKATLFDYKAIEHYPILSITFTKDSKQLISTTYGKIQIWCLNTFKLLKEYNNIHPFDEWITCIEMVGVGENVLTGCSDGEIIEWQLSTGKTLNKYIGHTDLVCSIQVSNNGKQFISTSHDNSLKIWNFLTKKNISIETDSWLLSGCFSLDNKKIFLINNKSKLLVYRSLNKKIIPNSKALSSKFIYSATPLPRNQFLSISSNTATLWNSIKFSIITEFTVDEKLTCCFYFVKNRNTIIVLGDESGNVHFLKIIL
ncbi:wd40 repeat protein [Anaeramoeba flamelloides]|uniref:Wd40 repeat protein n=1 Tax=Anaeramoeba flamelloides TaxID=1746091 RepID=A0ABQ8XNF1_9EUKA|nr:wd40 repeat protein [Anaeramoeba flamelloides]